MHNRWRVSPCMWKNEAPSIHHLLYFYCRWVYYRSWILDGAFMPNTICWANKCKYWVCLHSGINQAHLLQLSSWWINIRHSAWTIRYFQFAIQYSCTISGWYSCFSIFVAFSRQCNNFGLNWASLIHRPAIESFHENYTCVMESSGSRISQVSIWPMIYLMYWQGIYFTVKKVLSG